MKTIKEIEKEFDEETIKATIRKLKPKEVRKIVRLTEAGGLSGSESNMVGLMETNNIALMKVIDGDGNVVNQEEIPMDVASWAYKEIQEYSGLSAKKNKKSEEPSKEEPKT